MAEQLRLGLDVPENDGPRYVRGWFMSGRGLDRKALHESGWRVSHCGHPTALWPWAVYSPEGRLVTCGDEEHLGVAFRTLQMAKDFIEMRASGVHHSEAAKTVRERKYGR
jgi:hypothetical protein